MDPCCTQSLSRKAALANNHPNYGHYSLSPTAVRTSNLDRAVKDTAPQVVEARIPDPEPSKAANSAASRARPVKRATSTAKAATMVLAAATAISSGLHGMAIDFSLDTTSATEEHCPLLPSVNSKSTSTAMDSESGRHWLGCLNLFPDVYSRAGGRHGPASGDI
jgi:hypothetical protein